MPVVTNHALRLASYNIRAGLGTDWRRDPARVLSVIETLAPDVAVLQEADFRLGKRPTALPKNRIAELTGLRPIPLEGHQDSLGWHGIAILANRGFDPIEVDCIDLPGLEPRGAVIADMMSPIGPLRLVGVHLGLMRWARRRQLDHLRLVLSARKPYPTVIAGDFNEWSVKRGLGRIARDYRIVTPGRSFPSIRPLLPLDRIAHSPELQVTAQKLPQSLSAPHASDHLPILVEISSGDEERRQLMHG